MRGTASPKTHRARDREAIKRVFAYVRVHGLAASVETLAHGAGRPVVLCGESGQQVASVSPAAARHGVRPGMSRWEAQQRCPEVVIAQPDPEKYEHFWQRVADICGDYSPEVRIAGGGEDGGDEALRSAQEDSSAERGIWLDLTGTERLFGPAKTVGQEIRNRMQVEVGLTASVGIGPNRMVARLACELARPEEVVEVRPEEAAEFVGRLPVSALPGMDAEWGERLAAMGIGQAKDLARLPAEAVERALGGWGRRLWEIARGEDTEEGAGGEKLTDRVPEDSVSSQVDLRPPTEERERTVAGLRKAAEEVARKLRERGQVGRQVRIELVFRDLRAVGARRTLRHPTRSSEVIFQAARDLFERMKLGRRVVRRVRVRVARLTVGPRSGQLALPLLEGELRRERLAEMVDRVKDRFGEEAITRASVHRASRALLPSPRRPVGVR